MNVIEGLKANYQGNEVWMPIPNYENEYEASNLGNIRSLNFKGSKGLIQNLKLRQDKEGYLRVGLNSKGMCKKFLVHRLIAFTFLNYDGKDKNIVVDHINNCPFDNRVENIQIITFRENLTKDKSNLTGATGVGFDKKTNNYCVKINKNGKSINLGVYSDFGYSKNLYKRAVKIIDLVNNKKELLCALGISLKEKTSKIVGVCYNKRYNKWVAYAPKIKGKRKNLGVFFTEKEAIEAKNKYNEKI